MFFSYFKQAHVNPTLKKPTLSPNDQSISRATSKVVSSRLNVHSNCDHLSKFFQSTYKHFHFTETALVKVHNISLSIDTGQVTTLTLVDLSLSFGINYISVLLDRLSDWYGISGTSLTRIRSFLTNRSQSIKIRNCF